MDIVSRKTLGWKRAKEAAGVTMNYRAFKLTWGRENIRGKIKKFSGELSLHFQSSKEKEVDSFSLPSSFFFSLSFVQTTNSWVLSYSSIPLFILVSFQGGDWGIVPVPWPDSVSHFGLIGRSLLYSRRLYISFRAVESCYCFYSTTFSHFSLVFTFYFIEF